MALFDNPYAGPYLMTTGLGLLQAAQPQPHGVNRYSYIADAVQRAGQNMMAQKQQEREEKLFRMQADPARARSMLMGGYDPATGITWDAGRAGLMEDETAGLMARGFPEAYARSLIPEKKDKYKHVPGVGLVDVSGEKPVVAIAAPEKATIADIIGPLLAKRARGEELSKGEQDAIDWWMRADVMDLALRNALATPGGAPPPPEAPPPQEEVPTVTYEEYKKLPSGTRYRAAGEAAGTIRVKP